MNGNKVTDGTTTNKNGENCLVVDGIFVKSDGSTLFEDTTLFDPTVWTIPTATGGDYMLLPTLKNVGDDVPSIYLSQTVPSQVTITFNVNGGSPVADQETVGNKLATLPTDPTKSGYEFDGWYLENTFTTPVTTETEFKLDSTIYAKWLKIPVASDFDFTAPLDLIYDGTGKEATVTSTAVTGDITITYKSSIPSYDSTTAPTELGTYVVEIDVEADGNYSAVTGLEVGTFTIAPKPLVDSMIEAISDQSYPGSPLTPSFSVSEGITTLYENTDYESVTYSSNTNVGTASVEISGMGNYSGTATRNFTILPAQITDNTEKTQTAVYTGSGISPTAPTGTTVNNQPLTVKYEGSTSGNYDLTTMPSYTDVGTHTIKYQLSADNHEDVTGTISFTITEYTLTTPQNFTQTVEKLTGEFTEPSIVGVNGETVSGIFSYGTTSGTYDKTQAEVETYLKSSASSPVTMYYEFIPSGNNYTGKVTGTIVFTLEEISFTISDSTLPSTTAIYGDSWDTIFTGFNPDDYEAMVGTDTMSGDYTLTVNGNPYTDTDFPEVGSYTWAVTFTGGAYTDIPVDNSTITIKPRELTLSWTNTSLENTGNLQAPSVTATNLVGRDTVTLTVSGGKTDVGTGYTATAVLDPSNTNYTLPSSPTLCEASHKVAYANPFIM